MLSVNQCAMMFGGAEQQAPITWPGRRPRDRQARRGLW